MLTENNNAPQAQQVLSKRSSWTKLADHMPKLCFSEEVPVNVLIGSDKTPFHVHEAVLSQIPYFKALLCWNEKRTDPIEVIWIQPEEFRIATHWAYTKSLPTELRKFPEHPGGTCWYEFLPAVIAYKAADQLMMAGLQNALVDALLDHLRENHRVIDFGDVSLVCEYGLTHTPLYQLFLKAAIARFLVCYPDHDHSEGLDKMDEWPQTLRDIIKLSASYNKEPWSRTPGDRSEFYIDEVNTAKGSNDDL